MDKTDKAEKLKAARKKLKEFQSHKQEPSNESVSVDASESAPSAQPADKVATGNYARDFLAQQQQTSTAPLIANYFDNVNGNSFDFPVQQSNYAHQHPSSEFNAPQQLQNSLHQLQSLHQEVQHVQEVQHQNFFTPAPFEPASTLPTISETAVSQFQPSEAYGVQSAMAVPYYEQQSLQNSAVYMAQPVNDQYGQHSQQLEQLNLQMAQLKSELEFHRSTAINLQKNTDELNRLRQESQSHVDVVKVLVSEKSSLMDSLQKSEVAVKAKLMENEELQNRLNMSRHRVKQLESEARIAPSGRLSVDMDAEAKRIEETVAEKIREFKESNARIESERDEIKTLLNQKRIELENLQKNFDHLNTELHLANVRISQLSDGSPVPDTATQSREAVLTQEVAIKQQQINELYSLVDQVNREKEASDNQYQNYVTHLTREMEALKEGSMELTSENDSLVKREQELLKHVSDLEKQIQQNFHKQKTYAEDHKEPSAGAYSEELQKLASQITALTESNETLKAQLTKIEVDKNALTQNMLLKEEEMKDMELRMERIQTETPNLSRLMTDFEDKSVAASRALSQNLGLKEQLDEMQRAFITMTNDKMELTEKLQSEMHLCKEMKIRYDSMEGELQEMRGKWQFKEDEMIRLSHENTELEKKILQQNIELDRLRHYESKEYHGTEGIVENELENYKRLNVSLSKKINILEGKEPLVDQHDHSGHGHSHDHSGHGHSHDVGTHQKIENTSHEHKIQKPAEDLSRKHLLEEIEMLQMEKSELLKAMQDFQISKKGIAPEDQGEVITNGSGEPPEMNEETLRKISVMQTKSVTPSMATEEALEKLQARFRRTMLEVAELTEEKQRLEHVVTQLQFETETIGEYITLYQYQRRLLKQKERDRDIQLKSLAADREKMNQKLLQLNSLIEKFVLQHTDNVELALEATKLLEDGKDSEPLIIQNVQPNEELLKLKQETAGKILEILSDIKTANSVTYETCVGVENCSCCLGKLETV